MPSERSRNSSGPSGSGSIKRQEFLRFGGLAGAVLLGNGSRVLARPFSSLEDEFESAAREYGVPKQLLLAMGYVYTRWEMPPPDASPYDPDDLHGRGAYGTMQLARTPWRDTLGRAAALTGLPEQRLKTTRAANIRGGAAVLSDIQGENKPSDLDGWYDTVAEYSDGTAYADQVYEVLENGANATTSSGERLEVTPHEGVGRRALPTTRATGDYPDAGFYGAHPNNYMSGRTYRGRAHDVNKIVVHVMQ
ncbi:MAG: hypothetical protein ACRDTR_16615, partial [Rubrobacter sp.]